MIVFLVLALSIVVLFVSYAGRPAIALISPSSLIGVYSVLYFILPVSAIELGAQHPWLQHLQANQELRLGGIPIIAMLSVALFASLLWPVRENRRVTEYVVPHWAVSSAKVLWAIGALTFVFLLMTKAINFDANEESEALKAKFLLYFIDNMTMAILVIAASPRRQMMKLAILVVITIAIYALLGSRFRIVSLAIALLGVFLSTPEFTKKAKTLVVLFSVPAIATLLMVFRAGRSYRSGFNMDGLAGQTITSLASATLGETGTHIAGIRILQEFWYGRLSPSLDPLLVAASTFVPRIVWPDKPLPEYLNAIPNALPSALERSGAALPIYGDFLFLGGIFGGVILLIMWTCTLQYFFAKAVYSGRSIVAVALSIVAFFWITRGYLSQAIVYMAFMLMPFSIIIKYKFVISGSKRGNSSNNNINAHNGLLKNNGYIG